MNRTLPFLATITLAALTSCQNSNDTTKLVEPVPKPAPLPAWTALAEKPISVRSKNQVKIITKFVEISTLASAPNAPALSKKTSQKVLSPDQAEKYLRQLAQKKGTDIMTSPSVITAEGQVAKVEIGREIVYPSQDNPKAFKNEMTGTAQYVRARPGKVSKSFKLDVVAQSKELLGFHPFKENHLEPVFETRRLTGSATLKNGHSLVLSGLVTDRAQEVEDRVLFFSTKRTEKVRTELIAIITVQSIDRSGKPN